MRFDDTIQAKVIDLARSYGAKRLILFGSALDRSHDARDIDLACDGIDGWEIYGFAARLEEVTGATVDVIPLTPQTRFTRHIERIGQRLM